MSEKPSPTSFVLLDLDRTLLDTAKLVGYYDGQLAAQFATSVLINLAQARSESEARGVSFDIHSHLVAEIGLVKTTQFNQDFLLKYRTVDMLNPGAAALLTFLSQHNQACGILTHGSQAWQDFKLVAAQLDHVPHIITDQARKAGVTLAAWRRDDGQFQVPVELLPSGNQAGRLFDRILVVDDKLTALEDMPGGGQGLLYLPEPRPNEAARSYPDLPASITTISRLDQVGGYLRPQAVGQTLSTRREQYASI